MQVNPFAPARVWFALQEPESSEVGRPLHSDDWRYVVATDSLGTGRVRRIETDYSVQRNHWEAVLLQPWD